ncbi:MAG: 50S ribosome-binding GTPase [Desulfurococcales archaeon]|nr:50S ribosome-binding GTPase [Desulfurococcales archaeon]
MKAEPAQAKRIHVPSYEEVLGKIKSRYPRRARTLVDREIARLQVVYNIVESKTDFVKDVRRLLSGLHPFYTRLIQIEFPGGELEKAIGCIEKARRVARRMWEKYRFLILAAEDKREALKASSEGRGRILSALKRCRRSLETLREFVKFVKSLPSIDATLKTIIVAGPPSTGKSTFVRNVSRARPEVAPYPFTTKNISIGHFTARSGEKIQVIDTPGILDRPLTQMNEIERRAAAALSEIDGCILFLVDPTSEAYMSPERQASMLETISTITAGKPIVVAINKVDIASPHTVEHVKAKIREAAEKSGANIVEIRELSAIDREQAVKTAEWIVDRILLRKE